MSKTINPPIPACILLCQHRSYRKVGSSKVLQAFKELPQEVSVVAGGCRGHCGSGPNALVLPEIWYSHMQPTIVADIIQWHYVTAMLPGQFLTHTSASRSQTGAPLQPG